MRGKLLDTADQLLCTINSRIAHPDADATNEELMKAAQMILDKVAPDAGGGKGPNGHNQSGHSIDVNINIPLETLQNAQRLQAERSRALTVIPHAQTSSDSEIS